VLAVGTGWLREEFDALAVPFAARGPRTDDYLAVCKALWSGGEVRFDGRHYQLPPVRTGPQPAQRPHPPLWIAGNSRAAIERAARLGDGWHAIYSRRRNSRRWWESSTRACRRMDGHPSRSP